MNFIRIDNDRLGESYFSDQEWDLHAGSFTPPSPAGYFTTKQMQSECVLMMHHPSGYQDEWHTAPAPVLGIVLTGNVCIQTSDMDERILNAGDQFLACDLKGKGHRMSEVKGEPYNLALVVLNSVPANKLFEK